MGVDDIITYLDLVADDLGHGQVRSLVETLFKRLENHMLLMFIISFELLHT